MADKKNRNKRLVTLLTAEEDAFINSYLDKYRIANKGRWVRETLISFIYQNLGNDYPTLFNEQEMRR